jgi:hypothetical protein
VRLQLAAAYSIQLWICEVMLDHVLNITASHQVWSSSRDPPELATLRFQRCSASPLTCWTDAAGWCCCRRRSARMSKFATQPRPPRTRIATRTHPRVRCGKRQKQKAAIQRGNWRVAANVKSLALNEGQFAPVVREVPGLTVQGPAR